MFTLLWLFAWLLFLKQRLKEKIRREVEAAVSSGKPVSVRVLQSRLYPAVRGYAYLAWFGQVAYMRQASGGALDYTPSMPGVSPKMVEDAIRLELRVRDGKIDAPVGEVVERLGRKLGTVVDEAARATSRAAALSEPGDVEASLGYAAKHGHPVVRFRQMADDPHSVVGMLLRDDRELAGKWTNTWLGYVDEYQREKADEELEAEFARMDAEDDAELRRTVRRTVREAEIVLGLRGEKGEKFPIGWARVPTGPETCPFCLLLTSRGPVYRSDSVVRPSKKLRAGVPVAVGAYGAPAYHWGCDCIGVPVFDIDSFDGYEMWDAAEELYAKFLENHSPDAALFTEWLNTPEGHAVARELIPSIGTYYKPKKKVRSAV